VKASDRLVFAGGILVGVSFIIEPLTSEVRKRLASARIKVPKDLAESRAATRKEVLGVLEELRGYDVSYQPSKPRAGDNWWIDVTSRRQPKSGPYASIYIRNLPAAAKPLPYVYIERGTPEVVAAIATGLASVVGPQLLDGEDAYGLFVVDGRWTAVELAAAMDGRAFERAGKL
jgi:hypothetical protein